MLVTVTVGLLAAAAAHHQERGRMDDTGARLVGACFGLGTLLSAIGFIVAGTAT
jgi:hypothetical protein